MPDTTITNAEVLLLKNDLGHVREDVKRIGDALTEIARAMAVLPAMQQTQNTIQQDLSRGQSKMDNHDLRLQALERDVPPLKELRRWVIGGILLSVSMMGTALGKLVLIDGARQPVQYVVAPAQVQQVPPAHTP